MGTLWNTYAFFESEYHNFGCNKIYWTMTNLAVMDVNGFFVQF